MTKNIKKIKKIRNYALLGTIISTNAATPAQATSLKDFTPGRDFINTSKKDESVITNHVLMETQKLEKTNYCISIPEFDWCNKLDNKDNTKSLDNSLLKKAKNTIQLIKFAEDTKVKTSQDGVKHIVYKTELTLPEVDPITDPLLYSNTHTSVSGYSKDITITRKKKVPEASTLIGLIVFFLVATKSQTTKEIAILLGKVLLNSKLIIMNRK